MDKNDLIGSTAHSAQISKIAAEKGLNGLLSAISTAMKAVITHLSCRFWQFLCCRSALLELEENPKTGEVVPIPSRRVVKFRPVKNLSGKIQ